MSMRDLDEALKLIRDNSARADFVGPRDESIIELAETALGLRFPPTYRRFLKEWGCGSLGGAEFYGLVDGNFVNSSVPNGVWLTLDERRTGQFPNRLIVVSDTGDGGYYAIDTARKSSEGESPIVIWFAGLSRDHDVLEKVAPDFGSFALDRVNGALRRGTPKER